MRGEKMSMPTIVESLEWKGIIMPKNAGGIVGANTDTDAGLDAETIALLTTAPDDWEFETVVQQSPTAVEFEKVGDAFIGCYVERRTITPAKDDPFDLLIFEGRDGEPYGISPSYKLDEAEKTGKFDKGAWYRITLKTLLDTGNKQPMKDFQIDRRR